MIKIYNKETNELLGRVDEGDLQFLIDHLEEESSSDTDYYLTRDTIEKFPSMGASPKLVEVLRGGLRDLNALEIRWERDSTPG